MRIFSHLLCRTVRYTSRFNILLSIVCLGIVLFTWNRCQLYDSNPNKDIIILNNSGGIYNEIGDLELEITERPNEQENDEENREKVEEREHTQTPDYKPIDVLVNGDKTIQGRFENDEVYIPFSFIKDYFEIDGQLTTDNFGQKFEWRHSIYDYFTPSTENYDPAGPFLWFVNYNVERRSRVKCITGMDEVPISTQWGPQGYYYPIQIAQYGLSHYSMLKAGGKSTDKEKILEDCEKTGNQEWTAGEGSSFKNLFNHERNTNVIQFDAKDSPVVLSVTNSGKSHVLSFDISFESPGSVTLILEVDDTKQRKIIYETTNDIMKIRKDTITYGIGVENKKWRKITRNLHIDLQKASASRLKRGKNQEKKPRIRLSEIQSLQLRGKGRIDNITLAETGHEAAFLASARWLVSNQDEQGGWPVPVKRKIRGGPELKPGWYSAMAQGQAMSILTRAYHHTKDKKLLEAAERATGLFHVKSEDHGILATYMDRYKWYEEYPLTPSLFVLNGFIYSLMGLYDLKSTLPEERKEEAEGLFKDGMTSLRAMILMFDSGHGTIYDLRHLTMDNELNLARWDYHATHVNQLYWITMVDPDPFYTKVLERWKGYFKGIRAKHN